MKYLAGVASIGIMSDRCTGCGMCLEVCPHNVFAIREGKAVIIDSDRCMECGACANNCAFEALCVVKGVGCAAALINSMITGGEPACDCSGATTKGSCC